MSRWIVNIATSSRLKNARRFLIAVTYDLIVIQTENNKLPELTFFYFNQTHHWPGGYNYKNHAIILTKEDSVMDSHGLTDSKRRSVRRRCDGGDRRDTF